MYILVYVVVYFGVVYEIVKVCFLSMFLFVVVDECIVVDLSFNQFYVFQFIIGLVYCVCGYIEFVCEDVMWWQFDFLLENFIVNRFFDVLGQLFVFQVGFFWQEEFEN